MENPLKSIEEAIGSPLESLRADIERAVKIALLREGTELLLSRLATLDTDRAPQYTAALEAIR